MAFHIYFFAIFTIFIKSIMRIAIAFHFIFQVPP